MRKIIQSLAALTVLALPVVSAHATTYTATPSLTDLTNPGDITATFASNPINFTDPPTATFTDSFTICADDAAVSGWQYGSSYTDQIKLTVTFTSPGTGSGSIGGNGEVDASWFGTVNNGDVTWNSASTTINLLNGSVVTLSLPTDRWGNPLDIDLKDNGYSCNGNDVCGDGSFKLMVTTNDPSSPAPTPEPSSLALLGTGIIGLAGAMKRKFSV